MNKSYILVLGMFFVLISCKKDVYISYNETLINIYDKESHKKTKESYSSLENYKKAKELETSHIKELTIEIYNQSKNLLIKNKSFFHFLDKKNEVSQDNTIVAVENGHKWIQKNNKFLVGLNAGVKNQRIYSFESQPQEKFIDVYFGFDIVLIVNSLLTDRKDYLKLNLKCESDTRFNHNFWIGSYSLNKDEGFLIKEKEGHHVKEGLFSLNIENREWYYPKDGLITKVDFPLIFTFDGGKEKYHMEVMYE